MKTLIIAEAGVNHNGDMKKAFQLIDAAKEAGADIVKFQSFKASKLAAKSAAKAEYQLQTTQKSESQHDMLKRLELSDEDHHALIDYAQSKGIEFLSAPFDVDSARFLVEKCGLKKIKLGSGEVTNGPLLLAVSRMKVPLILSTGMATLPEIREALAVLATGYFTDKNPSYEMIKKGPSRDDLEKLKQYVTLLHCTTEYPTPFSDVNLRSMESIKNEFGLAVGLSDHCVGISVPVAAVAMGATVIEKHFTLDKNMEGPDHKASLDPKELKQMVTFIREVELALGTSVKGPAPSEIKNIPIARKSLVASTAIAEGQLFSTDNLTTKRPGTGESPMRYWDYLGKTASKNFNEDDLV